MQARGAISIIPLIQACNNALAIWEKSPEHQVWLYLVMSRAYLSNKASLKAYESFQQISGLNVPLTLSIQASSIYSSMSFTFLQEGEMAKAVEKIKKVLTSLRTSEEFKWEANDFIGPDLCEAWQSRKSISLSFYTGYFVVLVAFLI